MGDKNRGNEAASSLPEGVVPWPGFRGRAVQGRRSPRLFFCLAQNPNRPASRFSLKNKRNLDFFLHRSSSLPLSRRPCSAAS